MRTFILGFALGVWLLQVQPALPEAPLRWAGVLAMSLMLAVAAAVRRNGRASATRSRLRDAFVRIGCVAAGATAGFLYAAIAAERRLADELPVRWEGQDIRVAGIVSGLPAVNQSDRSVRFAFDVERVGTPAASCPMKPR